MSYSIGFLSENPLVFVANFVVPPVLGYLSCLRWGPKNGILIGAAVLVPVVLVLYFLQVSSGPSASRFSIGLGYMLDEAVVWIPAFGIGCALGFLFWKRRGASGK